MPLAYAFLGQKVEAALETLRRQVITVQTSAQTYGNIDEDDRELARSVRADLWGSWLGPCD